MVDDKDDKYWYLVRAAALQLLVLRRNVMTFVAGQTCELRFMMFDDDAQGAFLRLLTLLHFDQTN